MSNIGLRLPRATAAAALAATLIVATLATGATVLAAGPTTVGLGTAAPFAVLAGTGITNTGASTITGDVGVAPAAAASITGFPPGVINGTTHAADAVAIQAQVDLTAAYVDAAARPATATHATLGGLTLVGGVYTAGGSTLGLTGALTLDGQNDPNSVWIFQATSDLVIASSSTVSFINGGSPCNVFWQVTSSATLGSGSTFIGTILALTSITMDSGVSLNGRALARNGNVTLISDTITSAACTPAAPTASPTAAPGSAATPRPAPSVPPTDMVSAPSDTGSGSGATTLLGGVFVLSLAVFLLVRRPARRILNR